ncbi:MAG: fumarylacetoacetate hydrolase family protein [Pseudomonadota bacterium]|nr:fumarylacetoacetate hydrolase family protein [Pseudomonadota bacterium]
MKIAFFDSYRMGVITGDAVVDVCDVVQSIPHTVPHDLMRGLIERFDTYRPALEAAVRTGCRLPLAEVRLQAPLPAPANVACMAVNYMEDGTRAAPAPINAFLKSPSSIIGPGQEIVLPDVPAAIFEGEAEMAVVIGRRAQRVSAAAAMEHVFGYVNFIDVSARAVTSDKNSFYQSKSRDTFGPVGPYIVTADEIPEPQALQVRLWVNGELKQDFNTSDMAHEIPRCIEWVSHVHALEPGDILATGTNHRGLNAFQDGDTVALEVDGLGRLTVRVRDDLQRTWSRETRLDRQRRGYEGLQGLAPQLTGKYAPLH